MLTSGAIQQLNSDYQHDFCPTVQIVAVTTIGDNHQRLVISDGKHFQQALISDHFDCELQEKQIIRILQFHTQSLERTKILMIDKLEVVGSAPLVGKPERFECIYRPPSRISND